MKGKIGRGSMWEMRDDETVWFASVFMQDHEVGEFFCSACACDVVNNMIPAVNPRGIWDHQTHFLQGTESENVGVRGSVGEGFTPLRIGADDCLDRDLW